MLISSLHPPPPHSHSFSSTLFRIWFWFSGDVCVFVYSFTVLLEFAFSWTSALFVVRSLANQHWLNYVDNLIRWVLILKSRVTIEIGMPWVPSKRIFTTRPQTDTDTHTKNCFRIHTKVSICEQVQNTLSKREKWSSWRGALWNEERRERIIWIRSFSESENCPHWPTQIV